MAVEIKDEEPEPIQVIKDTHTWVDEVASNVIKVMLVAFAMWGMGFCMVNYVGKDKGVDPNLVYGFFSGVMATIVSVYFALRQKKEKVLNG